MRRPKPQGQPSIEVCSFGAMHGQDLEGLRWIKRVDFTTAIVTMPIIEITHTQYLQGYVQLTLLIE
jgi:hypothetical protein